MNFFTAPEAPSNFTASVLNSTAIFVSWRSPLVTNGIILSYALIHTNTSEDCDDDTITPINITAIPGQIGYNTTLTGLLPYTAYKLCVQARTAAGPGNFSLVTVTTYPGSSTPPTNLNVTFVNSTSVELRWGYPETPRGPIQGYLITHNASLMENVENTIILTNSTVVVNITISTNDKGTQSYTISGLMAYTTYFFSVRAYSYHPGNDGPLYGDAAVQMITTAESCE